MEFYDWVHAHEYLSNSYVQVEGKVAWVRSVGMSDNGEPEVEARLYPRAGTRYLSLNEFEHRGLPPGFIRLRDGEGQWSSFYLNRRPARQWKVGNTDRNTKLTCYDRSLEGESSRTRIPFSDVMMLSNVTRMLDNKYPALEDALAMDDYRALPLSRNWTIDHNRQLFYRLLGKPVGAVNDGAEPVLLHPYKFLQQSLDEDIK